MSDEKLGNQLGDAENTSDSSDSVILEESASSLVSHILSEHNYSTAQPESLPTKRTLRQLICILHARMHRHEFKKLPNSELSLQIRNGNLLLRRLRQLIASSRRCIEFQLLTPLQEAIAKELVKGLGCETRFYNDENDFRLMIVYRPGFNPNPLELPYRQLCELDLNMLKEEQDHQLEPMSLRDNKLNWHQPIDGSFEQENKDP